MMHVSPDSTCICGPEKGIVWSASRGVGEWESEETKPGPAPLPGKANMLLFILHRTKQTSEQAEHKKWMRMESKSTRKT